MADIELVIKISEDSYKATCNGWMLPPDVENIVQGIKNGTPLEQEPIIDKIRAEVEQEIIPRNSDQYDHEAMWQNMGLRMALKVIDKYKAKTEEA